MARNNSFVKLEGTLDNLTFYRQNGKDFVKTRSSISKQRMMKDPAFKRTRENMAEFGGSAKVASAFREAFASVVKTMSDSYMTSRLIALMKRINRSGAGARGERNISVTDNSEQFIGFEFNAEQHLNSVFYAPSQVEVSLASRAKVTWTIPPFDPDSFVNVPEGATHFKLVLAAGYLSDYGFNYNLNAYEPADALLNSLGAVIYSDAIPVTVPVGADTILVLNDITTETVPLDTLLLVGEGIIFYQMVNTQLYELSQGNAMKIATTA
ncbi:MAG: hypothetical protein ACSHXF_10295 [Aquaticitalea sp.]